MGCRGHDLRSVRAGRAALRRGARGGVRRRGRPHPEQAAVVDATVMRYGSLDTVINNGRRCRRARHCAAASASRSSGSTCWHRCTSPSANHHMQSAPDDGTPCAIVNIVRVRRAPSPGTAAHGEGGPAQPHAVARGRVGALSAGGHRGRAHPHRAGPPPLRGRGVDRGRGDGPRRTVRHPGGPGRGVPVARLPLASYVSGSALWLHGGGERPAFSTPPAADHGGPRCTGARPYAGAASS